MLTQNEQNRSCNRKNQAYNDKIVFLASKRHNKSFDNHMKCYCYDGKIESDVSYDQHL